MGFILSAFKWIPLITAAIRAVENHFGKGTGKEKQDAAVGIVGDLLAGLESGIGRDVIDEAGVQRALRGAIDAQVALMNVVSLIQRQRAAIPSEPTPE